MNNLAKKLLAWLSDGTPTASPIINPQIPPKTLFLGYDTLFIKHASFKIIRESNSYEDAIKKSIALGNDTDTTAAVVGGLAGIIYGFENIPTRWYEEIRGKEKILELIDKIHFEDI